jgi:hypothetical protein
MKKIDEIAGEKHRRAAVVEKALREFIAREAKKRPAKQPEAEPQKAKPGAKPAPRAAATRR